MKVSFNTSLKVAIIAAVGLFLSGCQTMDTMSKSLPFNQQSGTQVSTPSPKSNYSGPRAKLAILRFTDSTGGYSRATGRGYWYNNRIGDSMAAKLTSELIRTKRFRVLNRRNMADLQQEIGFNQSGAVTAGSAVKFGKMQGARLVVMATVTDFEASGGTNGTVGGGLGGRSGGGILGVLGKVSSASSRTYMAINIEVVDVQTSETIVSEQVDATITDTNWGAAAGGIAGVGGLGGALGGWEKEPRGKALKEIIRKTVELLAESVPSSYYTEAGLGGGNRARVSTSRDPFKVKMQKALKNLGYYKGGLDGQIGPGTKKSIRNFQQDYNLDTTGELDPATTKKLNELTG